MKRRTKRASPDGDFTCVTIQGGSRGVRIETWKFEVFKALMREVEAMLDEMKADLAMMGEIVDRAERLKERPTTDPDRIEAIEDVIEVGRVLDECIALWDDQTRERMAAKLAEIDRLDQIILEKAKRVLELAARQGFVCEDELRPLQAKAVRSLTREDIAKLNA
jgi:hypothetical protein